MASKIDIQKKCEWCGTIFTAHKTTTKYCSHRCANLAYKDEKRKQRVEQLQVQFNYQAKEHSEKEFLTPTEVSEFLGLGRTSVYRYIRSGQMKAVRFKRKTLIKRTDIDTMFDYIFTVEEKRPKEKQPITEFYTTTEIKEKFNVSESWIFVVAKKNNIPRTFNRGKTYWSKKHIDACFTSKVPDSEITEWYSVAEIQERFGMKLSAIYTLVSAKAVPKRKDGKMVYYSKKHFDIAKGVAQPEEPQYYTIAEAMEKFKLTRDQLYHYAKYHNIPKVRKGKYTLLSRLELDKLFDSPIIL